jgi:hypothetical protein
MEYLVDRGLADIQVRITFEMLRANFLVMIAVHNATSRNVDSTISDIVIIILPRIVSGMDEHAFSGVGVTGTVDC